MHFLIKDDKLLKKYTIWDNVNADRKKKKLIASLSIRFFLKTKVKLHGDEVTDFYD